MFSKMTAIIIVIMGSMTLVACGPPPVAVSECSKVVKHVKSVLKDKSPSTSELTKQCKAASDKERGCAMAADKPMKILQCM